MLRTGIYTLASYIQYTPHSIPTACSGLDRRYHVGSATTAVLVIKLSDQALGKAISGLPYGAACYVTDLLNLGRLHGAVRTCDIRNLLKIHGTFEKWET